MKLRQLEVLYAIMRTGSITSAAQMLNVSQPAVSIALRHLEDQLKMTLFERRAGRLKFTPEAEAIYPDIQNIFDRFATLNRLTSSLAKGQAGSIALATNTVALGGALPKVIAAFRRHNPHVKLTIQRYAANQVRDAVVRREADLGITVALSDAGEPGVEILHDNEVCCISHAGHPLTARSVIRARDIEQTELVSYPPDAMNGLAISRAFHADGAIFDPQITVNDSFAAALVVESCGGIAVVARAKGGILLGPNLVVRPFRPVVLSRTALILPKAYPMSRASIALADTIRQIMGRDEPASTLAEPVLH